MNLQSIRQDLEIEYYAMMSRVVQFTRKSTLKNTINVGISSITSSDNPDAVMLVATNVEKKIQEEAIAA